ncbi:hypothetical protein KY331_03565 [Candidatus Woesearchaeota archaeon]|nr:hypothetical protein [Candidatus Woesearchaeota archaeon]
MDRMDLCKRVGDFHLAEALKKAHEGADGYAVVLLFYANQFYTSCEDSRGRWICEGVFRDLNVPMGRIDDELTERGVRPFDYVHGFLDDLFEHFSIMLEDGNEKDAITFCYEAREGQLFPEKPS